MSAAGSGVTFDIGALVPRAWRILMDNALVLIAGFVVIALILGGASRVHPTLGSVVGIVLGGPLFLGFYGAALKSVRRETLDFGQIFAGFQRFLPAFLAYVILTIFTIIGGFLCIIPGMFVGAVFTPLVFLGMHDRTLDFWPAIDQARQTVMASIGQWVLLFLVVLVLNIAGVLACGVGLFVSMPLSAVLIALAYEQARA